MDLTGVFTPRSGTRSCFDARNQKVAISSLVMLSECHTPAQRLCERLAILTKSEERACDMVSTHLAKGLVVGVLSIAFTAQQLMAANHQSLAGSEWRPIEITGEAIADDVPLFVRFEAEGEMVGHGGCNRMFGSYTIDNVNLRIGPLGGTRMACLPAIMKREAAFMRALQNSRLFLRDGTKLTLKKAQGVTALRLVQTDWD